MISTIMSWLHYFLLLLMFGFVLMHLRFYRVMAPRKTATATSSPAMTQAAIRKLVADSVAAALEEQAAAMARTSSNNRATAESESAATRKCTYKDFIACKPSHFKGTEGVTELARWFERTETVFVRSGCAAESRVSFATGTLLEDALSWWNATAQKIGVEEAYQITWADFKEKMLKKFCPRGEIKKLEDEFHTLVVKGNDLRAYDRRFQELATLCPSKVPDLEKLLERYIEGLPRSIEGNVTSSKPQSLDEAMSIAQRLLDREIKRNSAQGNNDHKRKFDDRWTNKNNNNHNNNNNKNNNNNNNNN